MRKTILYMLLTMLLIPVLIISFIVACFTIHWVLDAPNPLRRPVEEIRAEILELTPIGSSMDEVIEVIENQELWEWSGNVNTSQGFPNAISDRTRVGVQSIRVSIGQFSSSVQVHVIVYWGFDEDSNLVDIRVHK